MPEFRDGGWRESDWIRMAWTDDGFVYREYRGADGVWRPDQATMEYVKRLRADMAAREHLAQPTWPRKVWEFLTT